MTEIVDELRATRPRASDALRLQVLTAAARPPVRHRRSSTAPRTAARAARPGSRGARGGLSRRDRRHPAAAVRPRRLVHPDDGRAHGDRVRQGARRAACSRRRVRGAEGGARSGDRPRPALRRHARAGGRGHRRALRCDAACALDRAGPRRLRRHVQYATGTDGTSSLTLRVPSTRAGDAVTRLSGLGTIVAQNVQIQDLQESLDSLDRRARAASRADRRADRPARAGDTSVERARLLEQRAQAQAQLRELRASRAATPPRRATRRSSSSSGPRRAAASSRPARGSTGRSTGARVLAWEAVVALAFAVAAAPLALVAAAVWATRRTRRRREDDRLLAAS